MNDRNVYKTQFLLYSIRLDYHIFSKSRCTINDVATYYILMCLRLPSQTYFLIPKFNRTNRPFTGWLMLLTITFLLICLQKFHNKSQHSIVKEIIFATITVDYKIVFAWIQHTKASHHRTKQTTCTG